MELKTNEFNTQFDSIQKNFIKHTYEKVLLDRIDTKVTDVEIEGFVTKEPVAFHEVINYDRKKYNIGDKWGDLFDCGWFLISGKINNFDPNLNYELKLDLSGEAAVFNEEGTPIKGFTNGSSAFDFNLGYPGKLYFDILPYIHKDGSFQLWVEAGANDLFGNLSEDGRVMISEIVLRNQSMLKLYYDIESLYSTLISIDTSNKVYHQLYQLLLDVSYNIVYENPNWVDNSLNLINNFYVDNKSSKFTITAVGHAHMDLAWLWPIRETRRKIGRFITNMIYLIEKYDGFVFGISQPQQIQWLKEDYPKLFDQFKIYVEKGRIELQGGMWVEPDTNVPGEESLVRQMFYGQKYYEEEFNKEVNNLWLPDVFGYNGNLPQIIKKSGLDYFMTIKISWNLINEFPHHSFNWEGIDGTRVLTHMPPEGTYNSPASPRFFMDAQRKYKELDKAPIALSAYGIGNGGGGPGVEHVERILRQNHIPQIPKVEFGRSDYFFEKLKKYEDKLPVYKGELYLENHQGTYTSQSNVKQFNRSLEQKLKAFETLLLLTNQYQGYAKEIDTIWKEVLLYQFHDILPGSSIKRVYDEVLARYEMLEKELTNLFEKAFRLNSTKLIRFNPLLENVTKVFKNETKDTYEVYKFGPLKASSATTNYAFEKTLTSQVFETKSFIITLSPNTGQLTSIKSKKDGFEYLTKPQGNKLSVYKDLGDGWNIEPHYRKQVPTSMVLQKQDIKKYGPIIEVHNTYTFKQSTLKEIVQINTNDDDIVFNHELDWKDLKHMLRTSFPLNIHSDDAWFDIQFGHIQRSRLEHTSIQKAQFEMPGQQWVYIHNEHKSAALLTRGKYGYYVKNGMLDINLLRSTNSPGEKGDIDMTKYSYSLYLSDKVEHLTTIDQKAMILNTEFPLVSSKLNIMDLIQIDNEHITYSSMKGGMNSNEFYIRLYNRTKERQVVNLKIKSDNFKLYETNLIEKNPVETNPKLRFEKFEIKTIKVVLS